VFPLVAPKTPQINGQLYFLEDVCAVTGANLLDPLNRPLDKASLSDLGPGIVDFESYRFKSTILGMTNEDLIVELSDVIEQLLKNPESELDKMLLQERLAKVTGGIARLRVIGASSGELKEKRDRAEDAVCAVRGAIKYGCLPGGGWTLLKIMHSLQEFEEDSIVTEILGPALYEPVDRLLSNSGLNDQEKSQVIKPIVEAIETGRSPLVFDALEMKHVDAMEMGILDSTPAVMEALRNSLSIASLLGTLGGAIVFGRDSEFERSEAVSTANYIRDTNEANLRG
jgi:chaperonin GroEL